MGELVLIADDDNDLLNFLVEIVKNAGFRVSAATSGQQAIELFWEEPADVVLLDLIMPDITGIEVMTEIKEMQPSVPVFMMSGEGDIPIAVATIKQGACDFIVKPMDFNLLISTLKNAVSTTRSANSESIISEAPEASVQNEHAILTEREREILSLTSEGHSSKAIGDSLSLSPRTVETYRERAMKKLKLRNRSEVIQFVLKTAPLRIVK